MTSITDYLSQIIPQGETCDGCPKGDFAYDWGFCHLLEERVERTDKPCMINDPRVATERANTLSSAPVAPGHHSSICHPPGLTAEAAEIAVNADELDEQAEAIVAMADAILESMEEEEKGGGDESKDEALR